MVFDFIRSAYCFVLQDDKLKALVQKLGTSDWKSIASFIPVSDKRLGFFKKYFLKLHSNPRYYIEASCVGFVLLRIALSFSVNTGGVRFWIQN